MFGKDHGCSLIYPLVNFQKTMENHNFKWNHPLSMAIFHSYVTNYQRVAHFTPANVRFPVGPDSVWWFLSDCSAWKSWHSSPIVSATYTSAEWHHDMDWALLCGTEGAKELGGSIFPVYIYIYFMYIHIYIYRYIYIYYALLNGQARSSNRVSQPSNSLNDQPRGVNLQFCFR